MAPSTQSNSEDSPASCPAVRGSPRCLAQRPLPSITIATWPGTLSRGSCGGRTPDGCGFGALTSRLTQQTCFPARRRRIGPVDQRQRAQPALQVPLQQRGDQPAALAAAAVLAGLAGVPVAGE